MAKGERNQFRIRLLLSPPQRRLWKKLETSQHAMKSAAVAEFRRSGDALMLVADDVRLCEIMPDVPLEVARKCAVRLVDTCLSTPRGRTLVHLDMDASQVVFSVQEDVVRLPYGFGLTRYVKNRFVTPDPDSSTHGSNLKDTFQDLLSWSIRTFNNDPVLWADIRDESASSQAAPPRLVQLVR